MAQQPFNWSGFYAGLSGGGVYNHSKFSENYYETDARGMQSGGILGLMGGFNFQAGGFVFGLEGDASVLNGNNKNSWVAVPSQEMNNRANLSQLITLRPRIGFAFGNVMPYVTGGIAWGRIATSSDWTDYGATWSTAEQSWRRAAVYGGGVEYAFDPKLTARLEVLQMDFGTVNQLDSFGYIYGFSTRVVTVRSALSYRF